MKTRVLSLVMFLMIPVLDVAAEPAPDYTAGIEYEQIVPPQPAGTENTVEVVELFWYGCPHCYNFEPFLNKWAETKPDHVEYLRIPAVFDRPIWRLHAAAFYTAEVLDVFDTFHERFFHAIQVSHKRMASEQEIMEFFAELGVDNETFRSAFHSFAVEAKLRRAADLTRRYGIEGVPAMVVNGKFRIDGGMAGGFANMLKIADYLSAQELAR